MNAKQITCWYHFVSLKLVMEMAVNVVLKHAIRSPRGEVQIEALPQLSMSPALVLFAAAHSLCRFPCHRNTAHIHTHKNTHTRTHLSSNRYCHLARSFLCHSASHTFTISTPCTISGRRLIQTFVFRDLSRRPWEPGEFLSLWHNWAASEGGGRN